MIEPIYEKIITAKNGTLIPQLKNGKTVESKYNPEKESSAIVENIEEQGSPRFFIVFGIASGTTLKKISEKFPKSRILAVERTEKDIQFLSELPAVKEIKNNKNISLCPIESISKEFSNFYLPAKFSSPEIIENKAWLVENSDQKEFIQNEINKGFRIVSADYSVQAHFGKLWIHNIMGNLKLIEYSRQISNSEFNNKLNTEKTALVVAAGPTLDYKFQEIINNRDKYFIIATDTASKKFSRTVSPDIIISIDGQSVSTNHFSGNFFPESTYFFDLCANSSAASYICSTGGNVIFYCSGHPLCELASSFCSSPLPHIFSGAGTVTIAAVDLALKLGFKKIKVTGADFGYCGGKAYTRGTYLETLYALEDNRINTSEKKYNKLMFRTELISAENKKTTEILSAYKDSFIQYLKLNNIGYEYKDDEYVLLVNKTIKEKLKVGSGFSNSRFFEYCSKINPHELEISLLPYIAYLKNNNKDDYEENLKLAQTFIVSYNEKYEK